MKAHTCRAGVAALLLVVCLTIAPIALAVPVSRDEPFDVREEIIRIISKIRKFVGGIGLTEDQPLPPRP